MSEPLVNASTNGSYPSTAGYTNVEAGEYEVAFGGTWGTATVTVKGKRSGIPNWETLSSTLVFSTTASDTKIVTLADGWDIRFDVASVSTATALYGTMNKTTPNIN